jgi:hypothetical protein
MISAASLSLTVLVLRGAILKKAPNMNKWIPIILCNSPNRPESLEGEIRFWNLLDIHQLLCYHMDDSVITLLLFLAQGVLDEYRGSTTKMNSSQILPRFRQLETNDLKRQKLKTIGISLCDIVRQIMQQVSASTITRASEVARNAFKDKFPNLNRSKLVEHLLCSLAHHSQIQQIMKSDYGLDIFFGHEAVTSNNQVLERACRPSNGQITGGWDGPIFEDENVTTRTPTGIQSSTNGDKKK